MTKYNFSYKNIDFLLREYRLKEAFELIRTQANALRSTALINKVNSLAETYHYMSEYFLNGMQDSHREEIFYKISSGLRSIARRLAVEIRQIDDPSSYFSNRRMEASNPTAVDRLLNEYNKLYSRIGLAGEAGMEMKSLREKKEDILDAIFTKCWILDIDDRESLNILESALKGNNVPFELIAQVVTAITLGTLQYYDTAKLEFLLNLYDSVEDERISARLLTGIVLILHRWPRVVSQDKSLSARLEVWSDSIVNYMRLREILMTIVRTRDTDRVSRKMKEDLLPSLSKSSPEILQKLKESAGEIDFAELDGNPEWEKMIKESGIEEKMRELTEMQSEGLDVMMQAFANLKSFPFFNKAPHWFVPFDHNYSALNKTDEKFGAFIEKLLDNSIGFCDSDKYSFAFALEKMPVHQKEMMTAQIEAQLSQMEEALKEEGLKTTRPLFKDEAVKFSRDLYRFFKLYPRKKDYYDVFERPIDFRHLPFMGKLLSEPEVVRLVAEFYFKAGYYSEALPLYLALTEISEVDSHILEKIGYCYQSTGDHAEALLYYKKAELFLDDESQASLWLLRKMALCNRLLNNYDEAAKYYGFILKRDSENIPVILNYATMLLASGKIAEALKFVYKADYLNPGDKRTLSTLVKTEMIAGNMDKASSHLVRLTLLGEDLPLLEGHLAFAKGEMRNASSSYLRAYRSEGEERDFEEFRKKISKELRELLKDKYDDISLSLVLDSIDTPDDF